MSIKRRVAIGYSSQVEPLRNNERLSLLSDIASLLLLSDDAHDILDNVFKKLSAHLGLEAFFNYLITEDESRMRLFEYGGIPADLAKEIEWLEYGQAVCGCVARDKKRIIAEDVQCSTDPRTDLIRSLGITAYCCHPLIAHGRLIGTLSFGTRGRTKFDDNEIALMHTVCDLVATALERARLILSLKASQHELEEKVKERTAELRIANGSLQRQIEERTQAEAMNTRLAAIIESSDDAILSKTLDGAVTSWNPGAEKIFGYRAEEIIGKNISTLFPPDHQDELPRMIEKLIMGEIIEHYETVRVRKDGMLIDVSITVSPLKDELGKVIGVSTIARDITERKHAQEDLEKYRLFSENTRDIVIFVRRDGRILEANDAAVKAYGYSREELLAMSIYDLRTTEPEFDVDGQMDIAFEQGILFEAMHRRKDGTAFPVEVSSRGRVIGGNKVLLSVVRDITERRHAEEELRDAKEQAELYVDLMGHDINNMNQIGIGFLELLLESDSLDPEDREYAQKPLDVLKNSSKLIDNVRKLQSVKKHELKYRSMNVSSLLAEVRSECLNVPEKQVSISLDVACDCVVKANTLLKDVFLNIIGNAIKHCGDPVIIDIKQFFTLENGRKYCMVTIEDNGPGIPDELKGKLFARFQRGTTKAHGKGLGLYLSKALIEDFDGRIWVEDRLPGDRSKGSKFVVRLPSSDLF